jgi:hypothetical protein
LTTRPFDQEVSGNLARDRDQLQVAAHLAHLVGTHADQVTDLLVRQPLVDQTVETLEIAGSVEKHPHH